MVKRVRISARVPEHLVRTAAARATAEGATLTAVVEHALVAWASGHQPPRLARFLADAEATTTGASARTVMAGWRFDAAVLAQADARCRVECVTRTDLIIDALASYVAGDPATIAARLACTLTEAS